MGKSKIFKRYRVLRTRKKKEGGLIFSEDQKERKKERKTH
jgi:hypothetical protein